MFRKLSVFILSLAALLAFSASAFSMEKVVESQWTPRPIMIDGASQDWDDATPILDAGSKAKYALKNDGRNLYIILVLTGDLSKTTIDYTGIQIFLTAGEKKSKDFGFLFLKKQVTADELIASLEKKGQALSEERKAEIRKQKTYAQFSEEPIRPKKAAAAPGPAADAEQPVFRAAAQGAATIYEFKIPLSRINPPGGAGVEPGQSVMVGFEWGGMTKETMKDVMAARAGSGSVARQSQGSSDSGFSDTSGEGGGGGGDFADFNRDPRYKKHSFWVAAKLAAQGS
ncbi:MAG: hypothetical protein NT006_04015 [Candidatus Aminicenantes bacterium]|nr:hypothetical protein [Candidatus Aminicenantes bacterium]